MDNNDTTFFRLWRNIVINRIIFKYSRIYRRNRLVKFNGVNELRMYEEREFINELVYKSTEDIILVKGDLPEYSVLNKLDLSLCYSKITDDVIPYGVECIEFNSSLPVLKLTKRYDENEIQLSELPVSVSTISNVILKKPYTNNLIPTNITSLSFKYVDPTEFYNCKLPNTILELDIKCISKCICKLKIIPMVSFIPSSVTKLSIHYDETFKPKIPIIPSTVLKLCIDIGGYTSLNKGLIPYGVKELTINGSEHYGGLKILKDSLPLSITKLVIKYAGQKPNEYNHIKPLSIPNSVTDLTVCFTKYPDSYYDIFPNNLTSLTIKTIYKSNPPLISELPLSLKYLKIDDKEIILNKIL